jgi:putative intracellular protease/amidase
MKKVLMILTSNAVMGEVGDTAGKVTGIWAEELTTPFYALSDAGVAVHLASPKGGAAPLDPGSMKAKGQNHATVDRFLADPVAQAAIAATHAVATVNMADYDAVFFPGGHGTMWDLPNNAAIANIVREADATAKIIASVCHGAAGLVSATRADGKAVVEGRRVNSFTDAEEAAVGLTGVVPFALETRLRELGGKFESAANWAPFVVVDGKLITGQNPQSSELVAQAVLKALG